MKLEHTEVIPKSLKTQTGNLAQIREAQRIDAIFVSRADAAPVWYLTSKMRFFYTSILDTSAEKADYLF